MLAVCLDTLCWHCSDPIGPLDERGVCPVPEHADCCRLAHAANPDERHVLPEQRAERSPLPHDPAR